jgi:hypothetical protein
MNNHTEYFSRVLTYICAWAHESKVLDLPCSVPTHQRLETDNQEICLALELFIFVDHPLVVRCIRFYSMMKIGSSQFL